MEISELEVLLRQRAYDFAFIIGHRMTLLWGILVNRTFTNKYIGEYKTQASK